MERIVRVIYVLNISFERCLVYRSKLFSLQFHHLPFPFFTVKIKRFVSLFIFFFIHFRLKVDHWTLFITSEMKNRNFLNVFPSRGYVSVVGGGRLRGWKEGALLESMKKFFAFIFLTFALFSSSLSLSIFLLLFSFSVFFLGSFQCLAHSFHRFSYKLAE